ncbi:MAG: prolyl oligopeptidase family serine peptidase [Candidatus Protochlamydia sp.]|nr:prolyl oligopeptidase family serine peptidase [Candidatus Protochlamydia sp.]
MKLIIYTLLILFGFKNLTANVKERLNENQRITDYSNSIKELYRISKNEKIKDITELVFSHPATTENVKKTILAHQRRIFLFQYPSDGLKIKGFISLTPRSADQPLLVLFRTGNRDFGLLDPGHEWTVHGNYTVISSTLRGGVSEGMDEFGGADVDDVKNLIDFVPTLETWLGRPIQKESLFFLGPSRGGMEMFLTLARYPELQNKVKKVVALSSILDLDKQIKDRPEDMKKMFISDFGLRVGVNEKSWIASRNPLLTVPLLKPCLPILIIQGTADNRVNLAEGKRMLKELKLHGNNVAYWEIAGGQHTLYNVPSFMNQIARWLEAPSPTC